MATYPAGIYSPTTIVDNSDYPQATHINTPNGEIVAIETELGTNPKSISDAVTPSASPSSVANAMDMFATAIKTLGAEANWYSVAAPIRFIQLTVTDPNTTPSTGDGKAAVVIPSTLNGYNVVSVLGFVTTVSSSGTPTFALRRLRSGSAVDVLSTNVTIDASEYTSSTAATAAVINTANDDLATADILLVDLDVVGTGAKGHALLVGVQKP